MSRRALLRAATLGGVGLVVGARGDAAAGSRATSMVPRSAAMVETLTVDQTAEPATLDPANTYDPNGWSIVHSIYDALVQYGPGGELQMLLAESLRLTDPLTYEITLRQGVTFHNGEPFDAKSVAVSVAHIVDKKTASQIADNFRVIKDVETVDPFTVRLHLTQPAPWLPAQMAAWLVMLPPAYAADPAADLNAKPVGTGPYRFVEWRQGTQITLEANPSPFAGNPKGQPLARRVVFRTVPEASTRVADLLAGSVDLVRGVPPDQAKAIEKDGTKTVARPISGSAWVRIATDVAPFSDVRVRQALNYAVDVDAIVQALLGGNGQRLAGFFVASGLGYDPSLTPYPHDPDKARALLKEAGVAGGFETELELASSERPEIAEAITGQLAEVGVKAKVQARELATFNQTWKDPKAAPLRLSTWRPLFDPYTLLSLLVSSKGFLSRHDNPRAQPLIEAAAIEADAAKRARDYQDLARVLHDEPAAIYLYNLTSIYGVDDKVAGWTPRPDDYVILTGTASR